VDVLWILLIGLLSGWMASRMLKVRNLGLGGYLLVGVLGAFLGGYIFIFLDIPSGGLIGTMVSSLVGAVVLLYIIQQLRRA
jgi:uncharacterized membrane protein YeaQ/YmgE (transglycosylase-associated protein family)